LYKCATNNNTCVEVPAGTSGAASLDVCKKTCGVKLYMCNSTTAKCEEETYGQPKDLCEDACSKPTPIPPSLEGTWRGLQISSGFSAGEFTLMMQGGKYTFTTPAGKSESGTTSTLGGDLIFTSSGGEQRALYNLQDGEETSDMTLAVGAIGATTPASYATAMKTDEYVFFKCKDGKKGCSFSATLFDESGFFDRALGDMKHALTNTHIALDGYKPASNLNKVPLKDYPSTRRLTLGQQAALGADKCGAKLDCESCVKEDLCGWCSTPVKFHDGSAGPRCAGFSPNGSTPFTCDGIYSTEECIQGYECNTTSYTCDLAAPGQGLPKDQCELQCKPAAETYVCNPSNYTCDKAKPGHGTSKDLCEASCQHIKPTNSTPTKVQGSWRGLQINTKYTKGEVDVKFGAANFSWTGPGSMKMSGTTQTVGTGSLNLVIQQGPAGLIGKVLMGIYTTVDGPETSFISLALDQGANPPTSFDAAMVGSPFSEYVMAKCKSTECKW